MKRTAYLLISITLVSCTQNKEYTGFDYRVDSLLSIMTIEEKIGQMVMYNGNWEFTGPVPADADNQMRFKNIKSGRVGAMLNVLSAEGTYEAQKLAVENSRLGIPLLFGYDVIHGYKTMLPVPIAQAASWDRKVAYESARLAAREASAAGIHWTFAPMIDVSPDARWGRIMESAGEDPYLTSVMAKAWVEGYQGSSLSDTSTIAACAKHFAGYGLATAGRDYNTVDISPQTLHNIVLPPFRAAAEAEVATFMNAFNEIGGIPATGSTYLQRDILKGNWNYNGFIVSDWASIGELMNHGFAKDSTHAAELSVKAGSDMDMESGVYEKSLRNLVEKGVVSEELIDDAVKRILNLKYKLGLFDDPYRYSNPDRQKYVLEDKNNEAIARDMGRRSIVLLKNESKLLPLASNPGKILVVGPIAASKDIPLGNWRAQAVANSAVSLLEGIKSRYPNSEIEYKEGYKFTMGERNFFNNLTFEKEDYSGFDGALKEAANSDVVIFSMGEDCFQTGEGRSQTDISPKGAQQELLQRILKVNKNVVVVLMNGRPLQIPEVLQNSPAVLETWFLGSQAGNAIADVLSGDFNLEGKLPVTFPVDVGQEPLFYNHKNTGRPSSENPDIVFWSHYTDAPNEGILPFGWGLSYSEFHYKDLEVVVNENNEVNMAVTLENRSEVAGIETLQVYIRDHVASETQPVKRLVKFKKVAFEPGEEKIISFTLTREDMGYYNSSGTFSVEDGLFTLMVGGNSRDLLKESLEISF